MCLVRHALHHQAILLDSFLSHGMASPLLDDMAAQLNTLQRPLCDPCNKTILHCAAATMDATPSFRLYQLCYYMYIYIYP